MSHRGRRLRFNAIRSTAGRWLPTTGARGSEAEEGCLLRRGHRLLLLTSELEVNKET